MFYHGAWQVGDSETVWGLFEGGATLQIIQPQRFQKDLQAICAALESRLGCLVGCNAYLTPKGTQGLAPHHDDVELFVCQTQGRFIFIISSIGPAAAGGQHR